MRAEQALRDDIRDTERMLIERSERREDAIRQDFAQAVRESEARTHERIGALGDHLDGRLDAQDTVLDLIQKARTAVSGRVWSFLGLVGAAVIGSLVYVAFHL